MAVEPFSSASPVSIQGPLHVALVVTDLALAQRFYGEVLGLEPAPRALGFPGLWYQLGSFQLHLIAGERPSIPPLLSAKWGRNPHLALAVTDVAAAKAALTAAERPVQMSASGRAALFTQDFDGNIIELTQLN